jgi:hypothetical protein
MLDLIGPEANADTALVKLAESSVLVVPFGPRRLRAVMHLDVTGEEVTRAADIVARVLHPEGS